MTDTVEPEVGVPALPPLDERIAARRSTALDRVSEAGRRISPSVAVAFADFEARLAAESIASIEASVVGADGPAVFPARRRSLSAQHAARVSATLLALEFVRSHVETVRIDGAPIVDSAFMRVAHALVTSGDAPETAPGLLRRVQTGWAWEDEPISHPPAPLCGPLLEAAADLCARAPGPPADRAAWLVFTLLSIHPFVDGNGRAARLAFAVVNAQERSLTEAARPLEMWNVHRPAYVAALEAGRPRVPYSARDRDPRPFMEFAAATETAAADLAVRRIALLDEIVGNPAIAHLEPHEARVVVRALLDGWVETGPIAVELARTGLLATQARPASIDGRRQLPIAVPGKGVTELRDDIAALRLPSGILATP